jgi:rod shape-determining protein MreC
MELRDAAIKVQKLRAMLDFKEISPLKLKAAEVVGKSTIQLRNYATLSIGSDDGVAEGMPVLTEQGLVGRVIGTSKHYTIVQLLINRDTRVAAKTLSERIDGMITWDGGSSLLFRNVPAVQQLKVGDTIVTSNYSALFPENIIIGRIKQISDEQGTLFHRIVVEPAVNFSTLEEAYVVLFSPDQERLDLERRMIESEPTAGEGATSRSGGK